MKSNNKKSSATKKTTKPVRLQHPVMQSRDAGFSLIELLVVVAIILIIAAIAVPNLLSARRAANEASAAQSLRTVATAEAEYSAFSGVGFSTSLATLGGAAPCTEAMLTGCQLDNGFASTGTKNGYTFTAAGEDGAGTNANPNSGFLAVAVPTTVGSTGARSFCIDATNVVHYQATGATVATEAACDALPAL